MASNYDYNSLEPSFSAENTPVHDIPTLCDVYLRESNEGRHGACSSFKSRPVVQWSGEDCEEWAKDVIQQYRLYGNRVDLWEFRTLFGHQIIHYTYEDFCQLTGEDSANYFHHELQRHIRKSASKRQTGENEATCSESPSSSSYKYPDFQANVYPGSETQPCGMPSLEGEFQYLDFHDPYAHQQQGPSEEASREDDSKSLSSNFNDHLFTRIPSTRKSRKRGPKSWEFLYRLLCDPEYNPAMIRWEDMTTATFRLVKPETIAHMWGSRNNQEDLSYNNFARSLRYYYKTGILIQVPDRQLVYRFGPAAFEKLKSQK